MNQGKTSNKKRNKKVPIEKSASNTPGLLPLPDSSQEQMAKEPNPVGVKLSRRQRRAQKRTQTKTDFVLIEESEIPTSSSNLSKKVSNTKIANKEKSRKEKSKSKNKGKDVGQGVAAKELSEKKSKIKILSRKTSKESNVG